MPDSGWDGANSGEVGSTFEPIEVGSTFEAAPEAPAPEPRHKMQQGTAARIGIGAGLAAGHDDELGAGVQSGMAWLAKHSPRIAEMIGIDKHAGQDPDLEPGKVYDRALKENRDDKVRADHDWHKTMLAGDVAGSFITGIATGGNPAISGALRAEGDLDEGRGLNLDSAMKVVGGAALGYASGKVGEKVGGFVNDKVIQPIGRAAGRLAGRAEGNIMNQAMAEAEKEVAQHNGALGPPEAEFRKNLLRLANAKHTRTLNAAEQAELDQLMPKYQQGMRDIYGDAIENVGTYQPGTAIENDMNRVLSHGERIVGEQRQALKDGALHDIGQGLKHIPGVEPVWAGAKYVAKRFGDDATKRDFGNYIQNLVQSNPDFAAKWGRAIMGSSSPAVAHHLLQQRDPEYREALRKLTEQEDGQ
jgi:hypothetical protein